MFKKLTALFLMSIIILSLHVPCIAVDYDEVGAYYECCTLYPDFVNKVKAENVNDDQIIYFLGCVEKHLLTREEVLSDENFDEYMFDAIQYSFNLRKNIRVRNALSAAFPNSVPDAAQGIITDEFRPIYDTVKRFLFGIKDPIITLSRSAGDKTVFYSHSVNLPEDCLFIMALYDEDGTLLHSKVCTPNTEEDGIECACLVKTAKVFAWGKGSLTPICDSYEVKF